MPNGDTISALVVTYMSLGLLDEEGGFTAVKTIIMDEKEEHYEMMVLDIEIVGTSTLLQESRMRYGEG